MFGFKECNINLKERIGVIKERMDAPKGYNIIFKEHINIVKERMIGSKEL